MIETEEVRTNKLPPVSSIGDGLHFLGVTSLEDEAATVNVPLSILTDYIGLHKSDSLLLADEYDETSIDSLLLCGEYDETE